MTALNILSIAAIAASIATIASRYLEILRPLWGYIPARWQWIAPAVLAALGLFTPAIQAAVASGADVWTVIGIVLSTLVVPLALAAMAGAHAPPADPPAPPAPPVQRKAPPSVIVSLIILMWGGAAVVLLPSCTPREIAKTSVDIAVATCQVVSADMQDEPDWLKLICQVAGEVQPFLVRLPANSPEAKALRAGAAR